MGLTPPGSRRSTKSEIAESVDVEDLLEELARYERKSLPENTRRAYRADWADFRTWCERRRHVPMPARRRMMPAMIDTRPMPRAPLAGVTVTVLDMARSPLRQDPPATARTRPPAGAGRSRDGRTTHTGPTVATGDAHRAANAHLRAGAATTARPARVGMGGCGPCASPT